MVGNVSPPAATSVSSQCFRSISIFTFLWLSYTLMVQSMYSNDLAALELILIWLISCHRDTSFGPTGTLSYPWFFPESENQRLLNHRLTTFCSLALYIKSVKTNLIKYASEVQAWPNIAHLGKPAARPSFLFVCQSDFLPADVQHFFPSPCLSLGCLSSRAESVGRVSDEENRRSKRESSLTAEHRKKPWRGFQQKRKRMGMQVSTCFCSVLIAPLPVFSKTDSALHHIWLWCSLSVTSPRPSMWMPTPPG